MAADLPAIVVHSILEIVRGISYEGENIEIRDFWTHNSVCCIHPSLSIVDLLCQFILRKHKKMKTCPWELVWAFHIVCI